MNNLRFSSGYPATAIKEELAPSRREEMENIEEISDNFQQGLRLCSPPLQASMDDYFINYHCSLVTRSSAHSEMSAGGDPKPKRSSSLGSACGLVTPKRSLSSPPTFFELIERKHSVESDLVSPTKEFNHGTPLFTLSNLSTPRTNFSSDGSDGSWTAGLQLGFNRDGSTKTKMSATSMEHFHSGGEMFPNTVSHSCVSTSSDDFDQSGVPNGPLANGTMNERAELLNNFTIVAPPHLDNSVTSMEGQRRAAKLTRALEEPFEYNSQNRIMEEYELQLTPMDNSNEFDFISLSPTFPLSPTEDVNWEGNLVFQFENQVQLGVTSEDSTSKPRFPDLGFHGEGSTMTELPDDHFRISKQVNMEAEMSDNIASNLNFLINLPSPNQPDINGASFADGTVNQRNAAFVDDSSAATDSHFNNSMDSIEEKLCTANLVKHLEFPIQLQSEKSGPDAESDKQFSFTSIHARRRAARLIRQEEIANEFNGQNQVMYEYEQMEPIDITDDNDYLCPSPVYQGSQMTGVVFSSDCQVPESMYSFFSLTSTSSLTEDSPYGNGDNSLPPDGSQSAETSPSYDFDALTSLEEQLRFINLAKDKETERVFFDQQKFVMEEYEKNEPMDVSNGMSYECSSPTFVRNSSGSNIKPSFFTAQDSTDTNSADNNCFECCCEIIKDSRQSIHPLLSSIDYSDQSLDQCGKNQDEQLDDGKDHVGNGFSDGWSRCAKDSEACRNLPGMDQSYYEEAADPTGRDVSPTGQQGEFQEPTLSGLLGSKSFPAGVQTCKGFDEDEDDDGVFTRFNDQPLGHTQMEGGGDEHFPHSQSLGSASNTHSSSDVDIFVRKPSAIERRAMSEFPGCSIEHAKGMLDRRLHCEIARHLDSVDTCNQEETVMMEFEAGLGSGVCDDEDDGFSGEVAIDVDNHEEDWNDETKGVCEAGTSQQSSLVNPPDSGGC